MSVRLSTGTSGLPGPVSQFCQWWHQKPEPPLPVLRTLSNTRIGGWDRIQNRPGGGGKCDHMLFIGDPRLAGVTAIRGGEIWACPESDK